jgi:ParB family chromosome partitioning protein
MRMPWNKSNTDQLDLIDQSDGARRERPIPDAAQHVGARTSMQSLSLDVLATEGTPLLVPVDYLEEDPANPRTEFPEAEIGELAQDIALRGILQPIVARRCTDDGHYRVLFGAKRLRAAKRAGLDVVPIVIGAEAHDVYAQVAENQKRHGLTPLDLARFMRARVDAGDSNAEIAKQMGIDLTSVAHHLALLNLPAELDEAFRGGRCTSPRTLYELAKLYQTNPERVRTILTREGGITRSAVASIKRPPRPSRKSERNTHVPRRPPSLADRASDLCTRLESLFGRMTRPGALVTSEELAALRRRLAQLGSEER